MTAALRLALVTLAALAIGGCSLWPFGDDDETPVTEATQQDQERAMTQTVDDAAALRDPAQRELRRIQQEIRRLQADLLDTQMLSQAASRAGGAERPGPALGLLLPDVEPPLRVAIARAFSRVVGDHPLSLVPTAAIGNALDKAGCTSARTTACLDTLAVSHGVRLLAEVSAAPADEGQRGFTVQLVDTELGLEHPPFTMNLPARGGRVPQPSLEAFADAVYLNADARLQVVPSVYHALLEVAGEWVLNQGTQSGLEPGQRLVAYDGGRVIRGPDGDPLAWIPEQRVGLLEVSGFTPNGLALARLVEGEAPDPAHTVVPESP